MTWENDSWRGVEIHTPGSDADFEPYGRDPWVALGDYLQLGLQPVAVESERWPGRLVAPQYAASRDDER